MVEINRRSANRRTIQGIEDAAKSRTQQAAKIVAKRRQDRTKHECDPMTFEAGEVPQRIPNSADVEEWFRSVMVLEFPEVHLARFLVQEQVLCKKLLKAYGPEVVQAGIMEVVIGWRDRGTVQQGFYPVAPTVALIWKLRQEIFGGGEGRKAFVPSETKEAQRERLMHQGEWMVDGKLNKYGWRKKDDKI